MRGESTARILNERERSELQRQLAELRPRFVNFVNRTLNSLRYQHDPEDIVQQAFMKAAEHVGDFVNDKQLQTWLYTVAVNHIRDLARRKRGRGEHISTEAHERELPHLVLQPQDLFLDQRYQESLALLVGNQREALDLWLKDTPEKIAAGQLGINSNTYKSRVRYARDRMKELLAERGVSAEDIF